MGLKKRDLKVKNPTTSKIGRRMLTEPANRQLNDVSVS